MAPVRVLRPPGWPLPPCSRAAMRMGDNPAVMTDPTPQDVQRYIADGLTCDHLEVEGDGRHFFATIVSAEFEGLIRVRRHQRVYAALGDRMHAQIHALSMKTLTPAEWASQHALGESAPRPSH
jgi:acid stress-induced BolA-like protein IbaG/YrbA